MKIKKGLVPSEAEGFTLIEILVVIAIIGSLSALLLPNYMEARMRARDAQRKSDLKAIQKALEMYKLDNDNVYPTRIPTVSFAFLGSSSSVVYMKKVPGDPVLLDPVNSTRAKYYYYNATGDKPIDYDLCACLENEADKDSDSASGNCDDATYTCSPPIHYKLTAP